MCLDLILERWQSFLFQINFFQQHYCKFRVGWKLSPTLIRLRVRDQQKGGSGGGVGKEMKWGWGGEGDSDTEGQTDTLR